MPLVVMCGCPTSGKTKRVTELQNYLKQHFEDCKVVVVSDVDIARNDVYADSRKEIFSRSSLKSAIERVLDQQTVVIADSLNYIKGKSASIRCLALASVFPLLMA